MATNKDAQLAEFLDKSLAECMEQCAQYTKQIIAQGHKELQPHLLTNVDPQLLSKDMDKAVTALQQRVEDKFIKKYQDFVTNNILMFRDDPCVKGQRPVTLPSQDLYEQCDENLIKEKDALYKEYVAKQQELKRINRETVQLKHEFNHTLKSINDNYQSMKRAVTEEHELLMQQCHGLKDQFPIGSMDKNNDKAISTTDS